MNRLVILTFVLCFGVLLAGFMKWENLKKENSVIAKEYNKELKEQLKKEYESYSDVYKGLLNGEITSITLIGDSVTAGVGASKFNIPEDGIEIFDNGEEVYTEASQHSGAWSNSFRNYIKTNFFEVDFINAGIGGKSAKWTNANKEKILPDNRDLVFVMLGTNDRWDSENLETYRTNLEGVLTYVDSKSKHMVVMSPPPSLTDGKNERFNFGMSEVNDVVKSVAKDNNYTLISHYDNFMKYSQENKVELNTLLQETGSHPIDAGYKIMWDEIQKQLTLKDKY